MQVAHRLACAIAVDVFSVVILVPPKEIRRYAGHYACITAGACEDKELHVLLARIHALDVSVVNPLLMSFFEDYVSGSLSHDGLASMLKPRRATSSVALCVTSRRTA